jgi:hypothetical protein
MNAPTKTTLRAAGYRITANADDAIVSRCAAIVRDSYLLAYVTESAVTAAAAGSAIDKAWNALTFVKYLQTVEFGTRTGGERKRFEYGDHLREMESAKADAAVALKEVSKQRTESGKPADVCGIWYKTQLFN